MQTSEDEPGEGGGTKKEEEKRRRRGSQLDRSSTLASFFLGRLTRARIEKDDLLINSINCIVNLRWVDGGRLFSLCSLAAHRAIAPRSPRRLICVYTLIFCIVFFNRPRYMYVCMYLCVGAHSRKHKRVGKLDGADRTKSARLSRVNVPFLLFFLLPSPPKSFGNNACELF